ERGSVFNFTARFGIAPRLAARPRPPLSARVLVVDDNGAARTLLADMLAETGAQAETVADVATALDTLGQAHAAGTPFGVALVDVSLPEVDGFALVERVGDDAALAATTVVLMITIDRPAHAA